MVRVVGSFPFSIFLRLKTWQIIPEKEKLSQINCDKQTGLSKIISKKECPGFKKLPSKKHMLKVGL
jgi:hypothetical protein